MTCEEVELALVVGEGLSPEAAQHLASCEKCAAFQRDSAQIVEAATLPALTASEKASLSGLAPRLHQQWRVRERRRGFARRVLGLAVAACLGAAIASAALVPRLSRQVLPSGGSEVPEWSVPAPELAASEPDDELDFEVAWPTSDTN